jgi:CubicO group peptidase (beta-lactamase class C family)
MRVICVSRRSLAAPRTAKRIVFLAAGLLLALSTPSFGVGLQASTLAMRINDLVGPWKLKNAPGMAALLIHNGRIEYRTTFGLANLETRAPITPETQFLLASLTKQFTAMAVLILMERHKLQLDDTLDKFCPEFPAYAQAITIRHLLNHTAGFTQYQELLVGKIDPQTYFRSSKAPPATREFTESDALQALSRQQMLRFAPGTKFEYSDSAYVVLAQIIERVTGQRYAEFLKENIFDPLGMKDTLAVDERKQKVARLALSYSNYSGHWEDITYSPENSIYGEDGIYSTLNDLYKWDQALYTDRLVSHATLEMAFMAGLGNDGKPIATDLLTRPSSYGFGWVISSLHGEKGEEHAGGWAGYATYILRVPSRRVTAIVLTNASNDDVQDIATQMVELDLN